MSDVRTTPRHTLRDWGWYWLPLLGWMALIFYLSTQPDLPGPPDPWLMNLISNGAHFGVYATLACLWWRALSRGRRPGGGILGIAFVATLLYGMSDEFHQSFVPGRDASGMDLLIDAVGAAMAIVVIQLRRRRATSSGNVFDR